MKIVVFGLGKVYQRKKDALKGHQIVGYIDNNSNLWGTEIDGIKVYRPDEIGLLNYDIICIMSIYEDAMKEQLIKLGVSEQAITNSDGISGRNLVLYNKFTNFFDGKKKVLFFSHDMSYSGAPIVLYYFACIMKKYGFAPAVISRTEGTLQQDFVAAGIPVIINSDLSKSNVFLWKIIDNFDYYILNTIIFADLIKTIGEIGKKSIWWLHDSEIYYENRSAFFFPKQVPENVLVYAVGERAKRTFQKYVKCSEVKNLLYGIPDMVIPKKKEKGKLVFAIIGAICHRKAQDIFIQAIKRLDKTKRRKAEFWIIGIVSEKNYYERLKDQVDQINEIKYLGDLTREEMLNCYQKIDVVCCPSRDDPMPVVMAEAFMNEKVAIVSQDTGIAPLIKNTEDGFVVQTENIAQLADLMEDILDGKIDLEKIGKKARRIFERNFSLDVFEDEIKQIIGFLEEAE